MSAIGGKAPKCFKLGPNRPRPARAVPDEPTPTTLSTISRSIRRRTKNFRGASRIVVEFSGGMLCISLGETSQVSYKNRGVIVGGCDDYSRLHCLRCSARPDAVGREMAVCPTQVIAVYVHGICERIAASAASRLFSISSSRCRREFISAVVLLMRLSRLAHHP